MATSKVTRNPVASALLKAATNVQAYARQVELREPAVSKPFYAIGAYIKTVAAIGAAL